MVLAMPEPRDRLQVARANAGFENATLAAREFGWNENTYRSHENGERGLRSSVAQKYATAFKVSLLWLLTGEGDESTERHVPIIASIREVGLAHASKTFGKALGTVSLNFTPNEGAFAYFVDTYELGDRYRPGDLLVCWPPDFDWVDVPLMPCVAKTTDGIFYLREMIYRAEERELVLFDPTPSRKLPIKGLTIELIQPIRVLVPEGQYSDVSGEHALSDWLRKQLSEEED